MKEHLTKFAELGTKDRIITVIEKGESHDINNYDLLEFAIANDPDINVRFSALKRIHNFSKHERVIPFLKSLDTIDAKEQLEPYLSMALSRIGIITMDEFEKRIS